VNASPFPLSEFFLVFDSATVIDRHPSTGNLVIIALSLLPTMISSYTVLPRKRYFNRCKKEIEHRDLTGKHVLVVGGTEGIGAGTFPPLPLPPSPDGLYHLFQSSARM